MGTRAIITIEGKPFIATHWDGNPDNLGRKIFSSSIAPDSLYPRTKRSDVDKFEHLIKSVQSHTIDFAVPSVKKFLTDIAKRIDPISNYGDYAEFQYDYKNDEWFVRPLHGEWTETQHSKTKFKKLKDVI
jgi:hypothetical protein